MSATPNSCGDGESLNPRRPNFEFAMGEYTATFPGDRWFVSNHMWAMRRDDPASSDPTTPVYRFGLTAYAIRLLQDVYFLDWLHDVPTKLNTRQNIGSIESKKAESDLYAPTAGDWTAINEDVLDDPSLINADGDEAGWLFEMRTDQTDWRMSPKDYLEHLESAWQVAQRTIKGQVNT